MTSTRSVQSGFTMVELMVTLVVIGILTAMGYPAYTNYTFRSRIPEGLEALSTYQSRMEQRFQDVGYYSTVANGTVCAIAAPTTLKNFTFTCTISNSGSSFEAKVVGSGPVSGVDYRINERGLRWTPSHPKGGKTDCWTIRGGMCDS